jgi:hypothetical protein
MLFEQRPEQNMPLQHVFVPGYLPTSSHDVGGRSGHPIAPASEVVPSENDGESSAMLLASAGDASGSVT